MEAHCQPGAPPPSRQPQRSPPSRRKMLDRLAAQVRPAAGGGRQNRRFGATALPITLYVHSSALPTRSPSTTTTAATPSPSAPNARPPRHREAVARTSAPPSPRCARRPPSWRRASKTVLVPRLRHARIPRAGRDLGFGVNPLEFEGPRTTFKIERGGCWIATAIDSSTTEGGYMAKPWAALPASGSVILDS
jgi:hypothetical protein